MLAQIRMMEQKILLVAAAINTNLTGVVITITVNLNPNRCVVCVAEERQVVANIY